MLFVSERWRAVMVMLVDWLWRWAVLCVSVVVAGCCWVGGDLLGALLG